MENGNERLTRVRSLVSFRNMQPFVEWDDIEEGKWYHLPPIPFLRRDRMDFIVDEKRKESLRIRKRGDSYYQTLWKTDMLVRLMTKPWRLKVKV